MSISATKCIVKDCENHAHEGGFVGDLCSPCHEFITTGEGIYSQAYRNTKREWVGLTKMELIKLGVFPFGMSYELYEAIEDKLKEKNR
jgi:hypothetical protein